MRVVVFGVGAVGGWMAAGLAKAGIDTTLIARGATLAALQRDGLVVEQGGETTAYPLPATDDAAAVAGADYLLTGLKGHDIPRALPVIRAAMGPATRLVPVINGVPWWFLQGFGGPIAGHVLHSVDPDGALAEALPADRVIGGVAHVGSVNLGPGRVKIAVSNGLLLGPAAGAEGSADLAAALQAGGVPARAVPDIRAEVWSKLWGNMTMNPLSALARADMEQLLTDPGIDGLVRTMMAEMAAMGEAIGLALPVSAQERIVIARKLGAFRTSMLQDLEAGRAMEVGPIIGALVEIAELLGAPAPSIRAVHGLVRLLAENARG